MDPALKQRLLGAAVLVALAIIFLPMLFDTPGPPAPPAGSLPLSVPAAPDRPLQTREIPLTLPSRTTPEAPTVSASTPGEPDRLPTVDVPLTPRPDLPIDEPVPLTPAATPSSQPAITPAPTPPAQPAPSATPPPRVDPAPAPAPAAATPPVAEAAPAPSLPAGNRYVVNLGSYANAANAQALLGRLKAGGVQAYSESITVEGKPVARLRAGPFAGRAAAEAAAVAIKRVQSDLPTAVIALDGNESAPPRAAPAVAGGFVVQVAAFASEAEANTLRDRLRAGGFATYVEKVARENGALWRVRVGPEIQRAKADEARAAIKRTFNLDAQVLTHP